MRQYLEAKKQYQDAIVFFRMGDFYEMFYEDALTASRTLEITLTSRSKDSRGGSIPMCGVPYHAVDSYLARLVKKGFRVAICEQMEDAKKTKGIQRRFFSKKPPVVRNVMSRWTVPKSQSVKFLERLRSFLTFPGMRRMP